MTRRTVAGLSAALAAGDLSSEELVREALARADAAAELNAFITIEPERALAQARAADRRRHRGDAGPLDGIPIAHKDIFCTNGLRTTCASRMLADFVPPYDAAVVERLAAAGMIT
ncbi:MAG: Asp-tRNA(Asn)/Glu-tRNA(Gln) amidotransferase GatCAB subunit A, partial [Gammaproteobacteria bacterium]|nr:Asp-tRNA(Asn)/Glu-tRNA(Gln) amidotransferase GatCAB subunit A [Gammaproteobacteria bacterium]